MTSIIGTSALLDTAIGLYHGMNSSMPSSLLLLDTASAFAAFVLSTPASHTFLAATCWALLCICGMCAQRSDHSHTADCNLLGTAVHVQLVCSAQ